MPCLSTFPLALKAPLSSFSNFSYLTTPHSLSSPISKNQTASRNKNKNTEPGDDDDDDGIRVKPTDSPPASHTGKGVEDNGNHDDDEEVKDVAEEVEGCSSGGRDDNIACQGIHWIVVRDKIDPENNDLRKWQCNVGSCHVSYVSKVRLRGHLMTIHAFGEVEEGMKGRPKKVGTKPHKNLNYDLHNASEEVEGCSSGGRDDNIARQGIHWIVVRDEIDPENNDLREWQCNVGSCRVSYVSKVSLRGHLMTIHAFGEVEEGMKGRPKKVGTKPHKNLNYDLHNASEEVEGCSSGDRDGNIARQGIHWIVVRDEMDPENNDLRKWQCNVGSCRVSYVSKGRLRRHLMAIHVFGEVEEGTKGRPKKAGGRIHKNLNYALHNARALSNPVERLARNESKARTRVEASSLRAWRKMVLWMSEHGSFKPPFLARLFKGACTSEFFGIQYWGEGKLTIEKFKSFKSNKRAVAIIRKCKESWAKVDRDAWTEEGWETPENTEKRQIHLDELINYHTHAKYKIMYDHHTEESYIEECWNNLKRRRVLEEPLRVDACIQSSKRYRTMAETLASKDEEDNSD